MPQAEGSDHRADAVDVFGARASYYTTSATHTDAQVLASVVRLAQPQPAWRVLDVGTGTGHTAFALAPYVREVIGLDPTPEMLAEAEALRQKRGLANVRWKLGDVHALPYGDATFELVTCRRAAHHFSDIQRALAEMTRVLAPGGRLVIDDRSGPEDDALDDLMNQLDFWHDRSHVRQYRPSAWRVLLEEAGLVVDAVEPYILHRPISSLTETAEPEDAALIDAAVAAFDAEQRAAFGLRLVGNQVYFNHWYLLLAATKPERLA